MLSFSLSEEVTLELHALSLVDMMTFRDDKISDHRIYWDNLAFMMQLGALG